MMMMMMIWWQTNYHSRTEYKSITKLHTASVQTVLVSVTWVPRMWWTRTCYWDIQGQPDDQATSLLCPVAPSKHYWHTKMERQKRNNSRLQSVQTVDHIQTPWFIGRQANHCNKEERKLLYIWNTNSSCYMPHFLSCLSKEQSWSWW